MSSLYPEMRFSWEIRSVDALFCNGMTRVGDLSREAILSSIRDEQVSKKRKRKMRNDSTNVEDETWTLQSGGGRWVLGQRVQLWIPGELKKFVVFPWRAQEICCFSLVSSRNLLFYLGERHFFVHFWWALCISSIYFCPSLVRSNILLIYLSEL